ncbi:hypothetical protein AB1Y20_004869 [Prymnesium parvum]|uniref:RNA-directed RNA polymerase n=1 Tax=Prymnesium parvum TaxID=97485 RepID=A0AB34J0H0_PRYPA
MLHLGQGSSAPSARCHREAVHACVCQMIQPRLLAGPTLHDLLEAIRLQIRLDFENAALEAKGGIGSSSIQQSSFAEQQVEREFRRIVKLVAPGISGTTWMVRFRIIRFIWGIPEMLRKKSHDTADVDSFVTLVDTSKLSGWRHHSQRMKAFIPGTALLASPLPERCVVECLAGDSLGDHGCIALPQHISLVGGRESMKGPLQAAMLEIHWPRLRLLHLALRQEAEQNLEKGRSSLSFGRTGSRCQPIRGLGSLGEDLVIYIGSLIMRPEGITFDGCC